MNSRGGCKKDFRKEAADRSAEKTERGMNKKALKDHQHLTLEMESLLVHSDCECAVVLVINADHSSLGKQRGGGGQSDTRPRHTPLSMSIPVSSIGSCSLPSYDSCTLSEQLNCLLYKCCCISSVLIIPFSRARCISLSRSLSHTHTQTYECSLLEHGSEEGRGGKGGGGIWETKGGERQKRVERDTDTGDQQISSETGSVG